MITKTLVQVIASAVPDIGVVNSVTLHNPQGSGTITYAINGGGTVTLKNLESVVLHGITNLNQLAFTGTGNVDIIYTITYEPLTVSIPSTIVGTKEFDEILTATTGTLKSQTSVTTTYQWYRNGTAINGATSSTYQLVAADSGCKISCAFQHFNTNGANAYEFITVQCGSFLPVNSVAPALSGTPEVGETISVTDGTWTNNPTFTYQWYLDGEEIVGADEDNYETDAEGDLYCIVTATNDFDSATAQSDTFEIVNP